MAHTTTKRLPPELWRMIVKDVSKDTLPSVSLTCRYLNNIARASIFHDFHLDGIGATADHLSRAMARLDFYASDAIAPNVVDFRISVLHTVNSSAAIEVVKPFFNALPRFSNLRSFTGFDIYFTQHSLQQIASLPSLEVMDVMICVLPLDAALLPMIRPRTFVYQHLSTIPPRREGAHYWLPLLDPDYLQTIEIPLTPETCALFCASDNPPLRPFPVLDTIKCLIEPEALSQFPQVFSKTPALRFLKLYHSPVTSAEYISALAIIRSFPSSSPPLLEEYNGPHEFLPLILGQAVNFTSPHLRRLTLRSIALGGDPLDAFMNTLKARHPLQLRNLTHLEISSLKSVDFKSLAPLQDMFPVLQKLHIHSSKYYCPPAFMYNVQLTDLCTLPLPPTLVSLSIQWASHNFATSLYKVTDSLLPRLPSLRRLWLCDLSSLALLWKWTGPRRPGHYGLHEVGSREAIARVWQIRTAVFLEEPNFVDPDESSEDDA